MIVNNFISDFSNDSVLINRILKLEPTTIGMYFNGIRLIDNTNDSYNINLLVLTANYPKYSILPEEYIYNNKTVKVSFVSLKSVLESNNSIYPYFPYVNDNGSSMFLMHEYITLLTFDLSIPVYINDKYRDIHSFIYQNRVMISNIVLSDLLDMHMNEILYLINKEYPEHIKYEYIHYIYYKISINLNCFNLDTFKELLALSVMKNINDITYNELSNILRSGINRFCNDNSNDKNMILNKYSKLLNNIGISINSRFNYSPKIQINMYENNTFELFKTSKFQVVLYDIGLYTSHINRKDQILYNRYNNEYNTFDIFDITEYDENPIIKIHYNGTTVTSSVSLDTILNTNMIYDIITENTNTIIDRNNYVCYFDENYNIPLSNNILIRNSIDIYVRLNIVNIENMTINFTPCAMNDSIVITATAPIKCPIEYRVKEVNIVSDDGITTIDSELYSVNINNSDSNNATIVISNLIEGTYNILLEYVYSNNSVLYTTDVVSIISDDRSGYAHMISSPGSYSNTGSLKSNTIIVDIEQSNIDTVSANIEGKIYTGLNNIINSNRKNSPLNIRIHSSISNDIVFNNVNNITFEGINVDSKIINSNIIINNCSSIEICNILFIDSALKINNDILTKSYWIHNNTFNNSSLLTNNVSNLTLSYNIFENLSWSIFGENVDSHIKNITIHHNIYSLAKDHITINNGNIHFYNNILQAANRAIVVNNGYVFAENNKFDAIDIISVGDVKLTNNSYYRILNTDYIETNRTSKYNHTKDCIPDGINNYNNFDTNQDIFYYNGINSEVYSILQPDDINSFTNICGYLNYFK